MFMAEKHEKTETPVQEKEAPKQLFVITTENIWKITTVVLAIVVIGFIVQNFMGTERGDTADTGDSGDSGDAGDSGDTAEVIDVELSDADQVKGEEDAPVTIVEYSDFQCPFCKRFYEQTLPSIEEKYIATGKVKLVYRHFPLSFHQNAQVAAESAECAGDQDKFWEMHDMLFENGSGDGTGLSKEDILGYAETLELDVTAFTECLDSGKYTEKVADDMTMGASQGVSGTPGFLVNGVLVVGAQPFSVFEAAIEAALAE